MTDHIDVRVAQTAEEVQRVRASSADLVSYPHVSVVVAANPDDVTSVLANIEVKTGAPCWLKVAKILREVAQQLEDRHGEAPCEVHP